MKKELIEQYQCSGCVGSGVSECFSYNSTGGIGCGGHCAGTMATRIGKFFLGFPNGFNRLGFNDKLIPNLFLTLESSGWEYDKFNIPVWKHLNKEGHTIVRVIMPRLNQTFLHIYFEDCIGKINCLEITEQDINEMD